ncbi:hypothetical protein GCM10010472_04050 [Pseudonocardia halophobica]|uniref:Uncharacterized protein n=1 Tax=Pseudonocardia halophobica TaxID=29401 RepID=A0A9W6NXY7_9PSEU|nr:hypothetical protein GCM10017577_45070 [Pseudonocardia halophobica]
MPRHYPARSNSQDPDGDDWVSRLIRAVRPAIYGASWVPWLRILVLVALWLLLS